MTNAERLFHEQSELRSIEREIARAKDELQLAREEIDLAKLKLGMASDRLEDLKGERLALINSIEDLRLATTGEER